MLEKINLDEIKSIALKAGKAIMEIYNKDFKVSYKDDNSPLTEADLVCNSIICKELAKFNLPILSEENKKISFQERKHWEYFWCIDPIDGTKEFTINIALIYKDTPVLGVVYTPAINRLYSAKKGFGAFKNEMVLPLKLNHQTYKIVANKSHMSEETKEFIDNLQTPLKKELITMGSSLKICLVASDEAKCYPRLSPTMEWDTAGTDAIARESEKIIYEYQNKKVLLYNKENLRNPYFIVA
ncbi:3'(2'),5'-bisphosphate nucleotidase CysQ [Campylobacter jejuni]